MACPDCKALIPDPRDLARRVLGDRWWSAPVTTAQAEVLAALICDGLCHRHAAHAAAIAANEITAELERRAVLPGTVAVRFVEIGEVPYEEISPDTARRQGRPVVEAVHAFVVRSTLSAIVEVDIMARRARVMLRLGSVEPPATTVLDSARLVHTSAQEIADALRMRRAIG